MSLKEKILFGFCFFGLAVVVSFYISLEYRYRPAVDEVCSIVEQNYFNTSAIQEFSKSCDKLKSHFPQFASSHATIRLINDLLSHIQTSHLALFDPEESTKIWFHESVDNGLRARDISGFVILSEILPDSPGDEAGFEIGDQILKIDQLDVSIASDLQGRSGLFTIVRDQHVQEIKVAARKYEEDEAMTLETLNKDFAVLRVKSFLSSFFEAEAIDQVALAIRDVPHLIVDLRGNVGGSFPAMVRLLSVLDCKPQLVGSLHVSPRHELDETDLDDDLDTEKQLAQIARVKKLNLRTSMREKCYRNSIVVLVDSQTASVAEIFADFLKATKRALVAGQVTSGQVVMAKWFLVDSLGVGPDSAPYSLSVPIADYENSLGEKLEDRGVRPDIILEYRLEEALHGHDSWIDQILKMRHKKLNSLE